MTWGEVVIISLVGAVLVWDVVRTVGMLRKVARLGTADPELCGYVPPGTRSVRYGNGGVTGSGGPRPEAGLPAPEGVSGTTKSKWGVAGNILNAPQVGVGPDGVLYERAVSGKWAPAAGVMPLAKGDLGDDGGNPSQDDIRTRLLNYLSGRFGGWTMGKNGIEEGNVLMVSEAVECVTGVKPELWEYLPAEVREGSDPAQNCGPPLPKTVWVFRRTYQNPEAVFTDEGKSEAYRTASGAHPDYCIVAELPLNPLPQEAVGGAS